MHATDFKPIRNQHFYRDLRAAGKLYGTVADAMRKRVKRNGLTCIDPLTVPLERRLCERKVYVQLDGITEGLYGARAMNENKRRKNFDWLKITTDPAIDFTVREINHGRYSSKCTYKRMSYRPVVHSAALILSPTLVSYRLSDKRYKLTAPRGYHWQARPDQREDQHAELALAPNRDPGLYFFPFAVSLAAYNPQDMVADWRNAHAELLAEQAARKDAARQVKRQAKAMLQCKRQLITTATDASGAASEYATSRLIVTEGN